MLHELVWHCNFSVWACVNLSLFTLNLCGIVSPVRKHPRLLLSSGTSQMETFSPPNLTKPTQMGTISPPSLPSLHSPQNLKAPHLVPPPSNHHQPTSVTPTFPIWHQLWLCWIILSEGFFARRLFLNKSNHLAKWNRVLSAMMNNTELNDDDVELILILVIVSMWYWWHWSRPWYSYFWLWPTWLKLWWSEWRSLWREWWLRWIDRWD